jgi:O-antigen ligase
MSAIRTTNGHGVALSAAGLREGVRRAAFAAGLALFLLASGAFVVRDPVMAIGLPLSLLFLAVAVKALLAFDAVPRRPIELVLAAALTVLLITPFLDQSGPLGTILRLSIAIALFAFLCTGALPVARRPFSGGRSLVALFAVFQLVPLVAAPSFLYGSVRTVNWVMFIPLAFLDYDARARRVAVAFTILGGAILGGGVILQLAGAIGGTWGGFEIIAGVDYSQRYTSFLQNPNDLGLFMLAVAVLAALAVKSPKLGYRSLGLLAVTGALAMIILTSSRGAFLALPLVVVMILLFGSRRSLALLAVASVVVVVALPRAVPVLGPQFTSTVASIDEAAAGQDPSLLTRQDRWSDVARAAENPVLGSGHGGYQTLRTVDVLDSDRRAAVHRDLTVDNGWLKLWLEQGAIGVALLAAVFLAAIVQALAARRDHGAASVCVAALLIALAFRGFTVDIFDINPWNCYLWLLVGIAFSLRRQGEPTPGRPAEEAV